MGRPKEHNLETRLALIAAAERIVAEGGPGALSVRTVADVARTTPRAVYSLFSSKEGLVEALAQRAFELLEGELDALPHTDDPADDLVEVGATVVRGFVRAHPSLHRIAFQRVVPGLKEGPELTAARQRALTRTQSRVRRLKDAGRLGDWEVDEAIVVFSAIIEGLANAELRGTTYRTLPEGNEVTVWRQALSLVVSGFASPRPTYVPPALEAAQR